MKFSKPIKTILFASALAFAVPAASFALGVGYENTVNQKITNSISVKVHLSEDLAHRANNLPEKLRDRNVGSRLNNGFANNGFYGERDVNRLVERLNENVTDRFEKRGISVAESAPYTLVLTIEDARPNRPTFEQLSRDGSLSLQSFGIGGAEIAGELFDANGTSLGEVEYQWYESDIRDAQFGGTWSDANRAFSRFAKRVSKDLTKT